jgi:hypothetical protein
MATKYFLHLLDSDGCLIARKGYSCKGCAIKHAPKMTPAFVTDAHGKTVWQNKILKEKLEELEEKL